MASTGAVYHQLYYAKNKEKLREKARERQKRNRLLAKAFVKASARPNTESPSPSVEINKLQTMITAWAIPPLLLLSTFLMIREMANVYSETWGTGAAVLIALAIEGFTLLFSFAHVPNLATKVGLRGLAVILALGSIFGMSANHYSAGLTSYRSDQVTERTITDLETSIKRKQSQSDALLGKGWIGAARKLEKQIDTMRGELTQMRNRITTAKPASAVASTTLFEIFIRFALTVCNILAAHLFGANLKHLGSCKASLDIPRIAIGISRPDNLKFLRPRNPSQVAVPGGFLKAFKDALGYNSG